MTPAERYRKAAAQLTDCASRKHTLKTAFIIISKKALQIECTVIDTSPTGVILQVPTTFGIPQYFDVVITGKRCHCRLEWKTDTKIAARFLGPSEHNLTAA
jgi:hypothetical protein